MIHGLSYVVVQLAGGVAGVLAAHLMFDIAVLQTSETARMGPAQWLAEWIATFGLVFTIFATLVARPKVVAMAVGLYITAADWLTASTSFANPAVTVARALTNTFSGIRPIDVPMFVVAQLAGAVCALALCRWLLAGQRNAAAADAESD